MYGLFCEEEGLWQGQSQAWLGSMFLTPACALGTEARCPSRVHIMTGSHLPQGLGNAGDSVGSLKLLELMMHCLHGPQPDRPGRDQDMD